MGRVHFSISATACLQIDEQIGGRNGGELAGELAGESSGESAGDCLSNRRENASRLCHESLVGASAPKRPPCERELECS
eukprot:6207156-Pleurochrysis_carterae.AAC.3